MFLNPTDPLVSFIRFNLSSTIMSFSSAPISPLPLTSQEETLSSGSSSSSESVSPFQSRKRAKRSESWRWEAPISPQRNFNDSGNQNGFENCNQYESLSVVPEPSPGAADQNVTQFVSNESNIETMPSSFSPSQDSVHSNLTLEAIILSTNGRNAAKEMELRRLQEILRLLTRTAASRNVSETLLRSNVINSRFSYYQLESYVKSRCGLDAQKVSMCPDSHMAQTGPFGEMRKCLTANCGQDFSPSNRFWYCPPSQMLRSLCFENESFRELLQGCENAQRAVKEEQVMILYDYYDGTTFREFFGEILSSWNPEKNLFVFLTLSTDGVELYKGRDGEHSCWPVMFTILNLGINHRYRASNAILSCFIPGDHDGKYFDTFMYPIIEDLELLQDGIDVICADGVTRCLKAFVLFCTADWPGATKLSGYSGHNSIIPCRYCTRKAYNRNLIPLGSPGMLRRALDDDENYLGWLNCECSEQRTNQSILQTWRRLDKDNDFRSFYIGRSDGAITRQTGIKRKPLLARLRLDFANAFPYDAMHLLLQGWVRLLITLLCGIHPKTVARNSGFVLSEPKLVEINKALDLAPAGFPTLWGRPPPRLDHLSSYKAETFKSFALFFSTSLFSGPGINTNVTLLWAVTRDILMIAFDPTPSSTDISNMHNLVQRAHVLFTKTFLIDDDHGFCFTPTTHALLHLPEILRSCGPLLNVSQFLPERVMGEVKRHAMSRVRPEANLFHKSQMLFGLRMFNGGLQSTYSEDCVSTLPDSDTRNDEAGTSLSADYPRNDIDEMASSPSHWKFLGKGRHVQSTNTSRLKDITIRTFGTTDISVISIVRYDRARRIAIGNDSTDFETFESFRKRQRRDSRRNVRARQKCWVAAEFSPEGNSSSDSDHDSEETDVYYGRIVTFWEVSVRVSQNCTAESRVENLNIVEIEWQNGLSINPRTETVSTSIRRGRRKGTLRDTSKSLELVECVKRTIGYFDHQEKRYFIDVQHPGTSRQRGFVLKGLA